MQFLIPHLGSISSFLINKNETNDIIEPEIIELVEGLLEPDPRNRLSMHDCFQKFKIFEKMVKYEMNEMEIIPPAKLEDF